MTDAFSNQFADSRLALLAVINECALAAKACALAAANYAASDAADAERSAHAALMLAQAVAAIKDRH